MADQKENGATNRLGANTHKQRVEDFKLAEHIRREVMWDKAWTDLIRGVPKVLTAAVYGFFAWLMVSELAGKATFANIKLSGLLPEEPTDLVIYSGWLIALVTGIYGLRHRELRKHAVEKLHYRIQTLELLLDQKRTSSNLTPGGDTRPEDK